MVCKSLDRIRRWDSSDRDPAQLGELLKTGFPAKSAPPAVLHSAERHLRPIMNRGAVNVADAGLEALGKPHRLGGIAAEHGAGEAVFGAVLIPPAFGLAGVNLHTILAEPFTRAPAP